MTKQDLLTTLNEMEKSELIDLLHEKITENIEIKQDIKSVAASVITALQDFGLMKDFEFVQNKFVVLNVITDLGIKMALEKEITQLNEAKKAITVIMKYKNLIQPENN